jgi:hypothetical protein
MDEFVKKTEEGIKALKETAEGIALSVEKQAKIAGKKMEIMRIQRKIQKIYSEVGEHVYTEYMMNRPVDTATPYVGERMNAVSEMKLEIGRIEAEMESIRRTETSGRSEASGGEEPPEAGKV